MLCLDAKVGERITVGNLVVKVCKVGGSGRVRLGFEGPRDVPVVREAVARKAATNYPAAMRQVDEAVKREIKAGIAARVPIHQMEATLDARECQGK